MARKRKNLSRTVTLKITCPKGTVRTDVIERPGDLVSWAKAAALVDAALCGCGRPHHAVFSDEPPHAAPTPLVIRKSSRPMPGAA